MVQGTLKSDKSLRSPLQSYYITVPAFRQGVLPFLHHLLHFFPFFFDTVDRFVYFPETMKFNEVTDEKIAISRHCIRAKPTLRRKSV